MEHDRSVTGFLYFKNLFGRLSHLQKPRVSAEPNPERLKTIRGLVLIFFSLLMGGISLQLTQQASVTRYRMQTWPLRSVWVLLLENRGLKPRTELGEFRLHLETHPSAFSGEAILWASADGCMVYLPSSPYRDRTPELWTCDPIPKPPQKWAKLGSGLDAVERLMEFLQKIPKKASAPASVRRNIIDPKEIRY